MRPSSMKIDSWYNHLQHLFADEKMNLVKKELQKIYPNICPNLENIWNAFNYFKFEDTQIVFVFLSPYNNIKQNIKLATGLATAVPNKELISPTLHIMLDDLANYTGNHLIEHHFDTTLELWANQNILLLNSALTTPLAGDPRSHVNLWSWFTGGVLRELSTNLSGLIFVLFGNDAKKLGSEYIVQRSKHHIVECCHPVATHYQLLQHKYDYSDIEPHLNFQKYEVFKKVDDILFKLNKQKIKWYDSQR